MNVLLSAPSASTASICLLSPWERAAARSARPLGTLASSSGYKTRETTIVCSLGGVGLEENWLQNHTRMCDSRMVFHVLCLASLVCAAAAGCSPQEFQCGDSASWWVCCLRGVEQCCQDPNVLYHDCWCCPINSTSPCCAGVCCDATAGYQCENSRCVMHIQLSRSMEFWIAYMIMGGLALLASLNFCCLQHGRRAGTLYARRRYRSDAVERDPLIGTGLDINNVSTLKVPISNGAGSATWLPSFSHTRTIRSSQLVREMLWRRRVQVSSLEELQSVVAGIVNERFFLLSFVYFALALCAAVFCIWNGYAVDSFMYVGCAVLVFIRLVPCLLGGFSLGTVPFHYFHYVGLIWALVMFSVTANTLNSNDQPVVLPYWDFGLWIQAAFLFLCWIQPPPFLIVLFEASAEIQSTGVEARWGYSLGFILRSSSPYNNSTSSWSYTLITDEFVKLSDLS
eukprot:m.100889 g.100889  ORF g.100889 m.100889 type:complete len:454 (-) comp8767_c0_seq1:134-1495(-)